MNIDEKVKSEVNPKPVDSTRKMENEKEQNYWTSSAHSFVDNNSGSRAGDVALGKDASVRAWSDRFSAHSTSSDNDVSIICSKDLKNNTPNPKSERNSTTLQKQTYDCENCGKVFKNSYNLRRHMTIHGEKQFECAHCNTKFRHKEALMQHLRLHKFIDHDELKEVDEVEGRGNEDEEICCDFCGKKFTKSWNLKMHRRRHTGERPYECSICKNTYRRPDSFTNHSKTCNGNKTVATFNSTYLKRKNKCEICTKRFLRPYDLKRHKIIHAREQPFDCPQCHLKFPRKESLVKHVRNHERNKVSGSIGSESINAISNKIVSSNTSAQVGKFKCEFCNKKFLSSSNLKRHIETHKSENPYNCPQCFMKLPNKEELDVHFSIHEPNHKEMEVLETILPKKTVDNRESRKKIYCDFCGKKFMTPWDLKMHRRRHTGERPFECSICKNTYTRRDSLTKHSKTCNGNKTVNLESRKDNYCDFCGKEFRRSWDLNNHRKIHTGERLFECSTCVRKFTRKNTLKRHSRTCKGNKTVANLNLKRKYECKICSKRFIHHNNLKRHSIIHTREQPFDCPQCHLKCSRKDACDKHVRNHERNKVSGSIGSESINAVSNKIVSSNTSALVVKDIETHKGENPYNGSQCSMKLENKEELDVVFTIHEPNHKEMDVFKTILPQKTDKKNLQCNICKKIFDSPFLLNRHRVIHTGEKPYECSECDKKYPWWGSLYRHFAIAHPHKILVTKRNSSKTQSSNTTTSKVDYHVCDWERCGRRFLNYSDFILHTRIHLKEYRFQCSFVSHNFITPSHLMGHIETSHSMDSNLNRISRNISDFNWKCYCFVRRLSSTEMKNGFIARKIKSEIKKRFECEYCGMKFSHLCNLKRHIFKKNHIGNKLGNQSNEIPNKISTDDIEMIQRVKKTKLQRTKEKTEFPYINFEREPRTKRCRFLVDYCEPLSDEKDTESKANHEKIKIVLKTDDAGNQIENSCNECDLTFSSSIELETHKNSHKLMPIKRGRPRLNQSKFGTILPKCYLCRYCNKTFSKPNALKLHTKTHAATKQYSCSECNKKFAEECNLLRHMRFHENRKLAKTTDIATGSSSNLRENSAVKSENTNMEIIHLVTTIKIEKEEPDVIETQSTAPPFNSCYDEAICKEELILFD